MKGMQLCRWLQPSSGGEIPNGASFTTVLQVTAVKSFCIMLILKISYSSAEVVSLQPHLSTLLKFSPLPDKPGEASAYKDSNKPPGNYFIHPKMQLRVSHTVPNEDYFFFMKKAQLFSFALKKRNVIALCSNRNVLRPTLLKTQLFIYR